MHLDLSSVVQLCKTLPEFGSLRVAGGKVRMERAFKVSSLAELEQVIADWQPGETLTVDRFPDGYRILFSRMISHNS